MYPPLHTLGVLCAWEVPSPPPPGVSILRPAFWGVCARDRDYNSSLEGDGLGWSAPFLRIPAGIGESRHPSHPRIPWRWREKRPTGLEPSRPGYSWANEVSVAALPGEVGGGGVGKKLSSHPSFPLLSSNAQAESEHCPRAVVSFGGGVHTIKGLACMVGAGPLWLVGVAVKGAQRVPRNKFEGTSAVGGL